MLGPYYGGERGIDIARGRANCDEYAVWWWWRVIIKLHQPCLQWGVQHRCQRMLTRLQWYLLLTRLQWYLLQETLMSCMGVIPWLSHVKRHSRSRRRSLFPQTKWEHNGDYTNRQVHEAKCGTTSSSTRSVRQRQSMGGSITPSAKSFWRTMPATLLSNWVSVIQQRTSSCPLVRWCLRYITVNESVKDNTRGQTISQRQRGRRINSSHSSRLQKYCPSVPVWREPCGTAN